MNFTGTNPYISDKGDILACVGGTWTFQFRNDLGKIQWSKYYRVMRQDENDLRWISYPEEAKALCLADAIKYREAEEAKEKKKKRK